MKKFCFSILMLFVLPFTGNKCLAQNQYVLEWSKKENSQIIPYTEDCPDYFSHECQKVRLDAEKNVIVGGSSFENGNFDFLVTKYANNGNLIWKQLIDISNESTDYLTDIFIDNNDNIIITGFSQWSNHEAKSVIIKLNSTGQFLWETYFSGNYAWSFPQSLAVDSNEEIYVTGYINKDWSSREMFVCKFDANGNHMWDDIYSLDDSGSYRGMTLKVIGNSIVSLGYFFSLLSGDKRAVILKYSEEGQLLSSAETSFEGNFSSYHIDDFGNSYIGLFGDFKIIKYDQSGNEKWSFEVPSNLSDNQIADEVQDIISDEVGNVYITGRHYGEDSGDPSMTTNGDLQINKISSQGNLIYSYRYENKGTNAFDGGNNLFLGNYNYLAVGGQSQAMYIGEDYDYVAIILNNFGEPIDTLRHHEQGDEVIKSVAMDNDLNLYVTGTGNGNTLTQKYSFSGTVVTNYFKKNDTKFKVFPNPFLDELFIDATDVMALIEFKLFDAKGVIVYQKKFDSVSVEFFDVQNLPDGFYFYQITSGEKSELGKLIKK